MGKHKAIHTVEKCDEWLSTRSKRKIETPSSLKKRASISKPLRNIGSILTQNSPPPPELKTHTKQSKLSNFFKLTDLNYAGDEQLESSEELPTLVNIYNRHKIDNRGDNYKGLTDLPPLVCGNESNFHHNKLTDLDGASRSCIIIRTVNLTNQQSGVNELAQRTLDGEDESLYLNSQRSDLNLHRLKPDDTTKTNSSSSLEQFDFLPGTNNHVLSSKEDTQSSLPHAETYCSHRINKKYSNGKVGLDSEYLKSNHTADLISGTNSEINWSEPAVNSDYNNQIDNGQEKKKDQFLKMGESIMDLDTIYNLTENSESLKNRNNHDTGKYLDKGKSDNCLNSESLNIDLDLMSEVTAPVKHSKQFHADICVKNTDFDLLSGETVLAKHSKKLPDVFDTINTNLDLMSEDTATTNHSKHLHEVSDSIITDHDLMSEAMTTFKYSKTLPADLDSLNTDVDLSTETAHPVKHSIKYTQGCDSLDSDIDLMTESLVPVKNSRNIFQNCDSMNSNLDLMTEVKVQSRLISTQEADRELENFSLENDSQIEF